MSRLAPWWEIRHFCHCGRRLFMDINEGTCLWCGTGAVQPERYVNLKSELAALPRDLGSILRDQIATGRRLPAVFDNVREASRRFPRAA